MQDLKKYLDSGLYNYNIIDYHRYLAALYSNNPNLVHQLTASESIGSNSSNFVNANYRSNSSVLTNSNVPHNFDDLNLAASDLQTSNYFSNVPLNQSVNLQTNPLLNQSMNNFGYLFQQQPVNLPSIVPPNLPSNQSINQNLMIRSEYCSKCRACKAAEEKVESSVSSNVTDQNVITANMTSNNFKSIDSSTIQTRNTTDQSIVPAVSTDEKLYLSNDVNDLILANLIAAKKASGSIVNNNSTANISSGSAESNLSSNLSALSIQSSNGTRASCSNDEGPSNVIVKKNQNLDLNHVQSPRPITKLNNVTIKESTSKSLNELNKNQVDYSILLPKILATTQRSFFKYCQEETGLTVPEVKAKLFNIKKSPAFQPLKLYEKEMICYFCKNNGEPEFLYKTHIVRDPITNKTLCPILRDYTCELCSANGDRAHTRSYCPLSKFIRENCDYSESSKYFNMKILTQQYKRKLISKFAQNPSQKREISKIKQND